MNILMYTNDMANYVTPPFDLTDEMLELAASIMENLGKLSRVSDLNKLPQLRKVNRIKSIQSSLAIENNTLSYDQVRDIIDDKQVVGPKEDIIAVKNAIEAYKEVENIDPYKIESLLKLHGIMMKDLVNEPGHIRTEGVGVYDENGNLVHMAPSYKLVKGLLTNLFDWMKDSKLNMLIKSSIFHYEFEFIHPFVDGNGRMGRLYQTAFLASYRPIFLWIPIESIIKDHQQEYYNSIILSNKEGKSTKFILFMLKVIDEAISNLISDTTNHINHINDRVSLLLNVIETYPQSAEELMKKLNLKSRLGFRNNYLTPALDLGLIKMTNPNKPTSKNQKYYKV